MTSPPTNVPDDPDCELEVAADCELEVAADCWLAATCLVDDGTAATEDRDV
jgi:hypothetical protein